MFPHLGLVDVTQFSPVDDRQTHTRVRRQTGLGRVAVQLRVKLVQCFVERIGASVASLGVGRFQGETVIEIDVFQILSLKHTNFEIV